jgi:hypothetical protein
MRTEMMQRFNINITSIIQFGVYVYCTYIVKIL